MGPCCQLDIFPSSLCLSTALSLPRDHHSGDDENENQDAIKDNGEFVVPRLISFLMGLPLRYERLRENEARDGQEMGLVRCRGQVSKLRGRF